MLLAHGVLGFDRIQVAGKSQAYFRGVPEAFARQGVQVHLVRVPGLASVAERAEHLARAVRAIDARKVNVIAHSMGGLDARYAVSALGLSAKVASLTTIGSPHRGTPLADLGTGFFGDTLKLRALFERLGLDLSAFYDLTTQRMAAFNAAVPDVKGVSYGCYLGHLPTGPRGIQLAAVAGLPLPARKGGRERRAGPGELAALGGGPGRDRSRSLGADRLVHVLRRAGLLRAGAGGTARPRALTPAVRGWTLPVARVAQHVRLASDQREAGPLQGAAAGNVVGVDPARTRRMPGCANSQPLKAWTSSVP